MNNSQDKRIEEIVRLMQQDDSVDAPVDSIRWVKGLYRTKAAQKKPSLIERIVASLQVNLTSGKAALGERSGSSGTARQMLFNAGENAIDLRVTPQNATVKLHGQVLGEGFSDGRAVLSSSNVKTKTEISENGEFHFNEIPKGFYALTLSSDQKDIVIEEVEL